ncbi:alpha/beta fold hydrolase [Microbacterium sp. B2969]|uniref:Alpha/beta fold hydrolase n=1 Tax=Microbacterium alkaliflavum TaxID=3248839 RepID=A0ABW7QCI3_9MICO
MTLWHELKGGGQPVIFLHHGIADSRVWQPQWSSLAPRHMLVRCDFAGFGQSPIGPLPLTPARDVAALLDMLGIADAVVVGSSMGGRVALELAVARPDLVSALVLAAPALPGVNWSQAVRAYGEAEDDAVAGGDLAEATEVNLRMWVDGPNRTAADVEPGFRGAVEAMLLHALEVQTPWWQELEEDLLVPDLGDRLGVVAVPTLVLVGDEDVEDFQVLARRIASAIPDARLATLARTAHFPNLEQPEAFDALVLDFLARIATTS